MTVLLQRCHLFIVSSHANRDFTASHIPNYFVLYLRYLGCYVMSFLASSNLTEKVVIFVLSGSWANWFQFTRFEQAFCVVVSMWVPFSQCLCPVFSVTGLPCNSILNISSIVIGSYPWIYSEGIEPRGLWTNLWCHFPMFFPLHDLSSIFFCCCCSLGPTAGALFTSLNHILYATVSTSGAQWFLSLRVLGICLLCCSCHHYCCHRAERTEKKTHSLWGLGDLIPTPQARSRKVSTSSFSVLTITWFSILGHTESRLKATK